MTDATDWVTVRVPEGDREKAREYKPDGVTWGDCLVAGAERLNDGLASDTRRFEPDSATADVDDLAEQVAAQLNGDAELPVADIREAAREGAREAIAELEGRP